MLKLIFTALLFSTLLFGAVLAMQHNEMKCYDIYTTGF